MWAESNFVSHFVSIHLSPRLCPPYVSFFLSIKNNFPQRIAVKNNVINCVCVSFPHLPKIRRQNISRSFSDETQTEIIHTQSLKDNLRASRYKRYLFLNPNIGFNKKRINAGTVSFQRTCDWTLKGYSGIFDIGPHFKTTQSYSYWSRPFFSSFDAVLNWDSSPFHH